MTCVAVRGAEQAFRIGRVDHCLEQQSWSCGRQMKVRWWPKKTTTNQQRAVVDNVGQF